MRTKEQLGHDLKCKMHQFHRACGDVNVTLTERDKIQLQLQTLQKKYREFGNKHLQTP